ncbi:MAG: class I SAM-dependent methyltransferase [Campylobacterales bacterium]|nr:class I SAM-dependent methyltransferase [Campylobacterales bacterium]
MQFKEVEKMVDGIPYISKTNAYFLYDFIIKNNIQNVLELGIAHGTATCYMAAALDEGGRGHIDAVDLLSVKDHFKPSAQEQLCKTGLEKYVSIYRMKTGYNWFLHDEILRNTSDGACRQKYDLCVIDGPKNWTIDSSAFFLVDKLLKNGGYIIFDDLNWTYADANKKRETTDGIAHKDLSEDELLRPHIRDIFEFLVMQHPNYSHFTFFSDNQWAMAQKTDEQEIYKKKAVVYDPIFDLNKKYFFAKSFSHLLEKIEDLQKENKRYLVYGFGSVGKLLWSLMPNSIVGFIDQNFQNICDGMVYGMKQGLALEYDLIIVSVLGREEQICQELIERHQIDKKKIVILEIE